VALIRCRCLFDVLLLVVVFLFVYVVVQQIHSTRLVMCLYVMLPHWHTRVHTPTHAHTRHSNDGARVANYTYPNYGNQPGHMTGALTRVCVCLYAWAYVIGLCVMLCVFCVVCVVRLLCVVGSVMWLCCVGVWLGVAGV